MPLIRNNASIIGQVFDQLTILEMLPREVGVRAKYRCLCSCGQECIKPSGTLYAYRRDNIPTHCGCLKTPPFTPRTLEPEEEREPWDGKEMRITASVFFERLDELEWMISRKSKGVSSLADANRELAQTIDSFLKKCLYRK